MYVERNQACGNPLRLLQHILKHHVFAGGIGGSVNEGITAKLSEVLKDILDISNDRFYIKVAQR